MKKLLPLLFLLLAIDELQAQTRYIVRFRNKGNGPYTFSAPLSYLSQRALDRRTRYGISIDSLDLPVTPTYVNQVAAVTGVTLLNVSKWMNAVTIQTSTPAALTTINSFPFVLSVSGIASRMAEGGRTVGDKFDSEIFIPGLPVSSSTERIAANYFNYGTGSSYNEIHLHWGEFLHNIGLRGQSMQVALLDNGFNNYTSAANDAFDSINANGQVLGTWDFVAREANVTNDGNHGMQCFSTIAANVPGQFIGKAPKASFWLFQTEDNSSEYPVEEFNWSCGAERADSAGVDVLSTSLGYYNFDAPLSSANHVYADMNGNTTMISIAADLAAKKGILVFASIGNEGTNAWHFLTPPSDGDSVMAVGAVNTSGAVGNFSSYGPSSDGQIKPDMASVGVSAVVQFNGVIGTNNGTSFPAPNMAGLGTILW